VAPPAAYPTRRERQRKGRLTDASWRVPAKVSCFSTLPETIAAELREIEDDLRDLSSEREKTEPDVEVVVITEIENPDRLEGES